MPKLRGLVVGAGVAGKAVAHCMSDDGRAETVAFCESLASQRKKAAEVFPEAVIGEDYRDLLDQRRRSAAAKPATPELMLVPVMNAAVRRIPPSPVSRCLNSKP